MIVVECGFGKDVVVFFVLLVEGGLEIFDGGFFV